MRLLRLALAGESLLHQLADRFPPGTARKLIAQIERFPAPIEFHCSHHDRTRLRHERFGLRPELVRHGGLLCAVIDRIEALASEAGHAAVLVLRSIE